METAIFWLTLLGAIIISIACAIYYGESKKFGGWIGFVGAILVLFAAAFQWWPEPNKDDIKIDQLRAYVSIVGASIENFGTTSPLTATVIIKNAGKTPAYKFTNKARVVVREFPLKEPLPKPEAPSAEIPLGVGSLFYLRGQTDRGLTQKEINDVKQGLKAIYVYGNVNYLTFNKKRHTNFILFFGGKEGITNDGTLHPYSEGNEEN